MNQAEIASGLRHALDPVTFAVERLEITPDPWQERVLRSSSRRVLLNCSRQSGKSATTAILASHEALYRPGCLILLVSRALRQAVELFGKVAAHLRALHVPLAEDNATSCRLTNGSRIVALPGDKGDTLRGFSAPSLVIFDEAAFALDDVYHAVRPMLAVSHGRLMLLSTPHGKRGFFHQAWTSAAEEWERVRVPATDCPRITTGFLEAERDALGDWRFAQEYECAFVEAESQFFAESTIMAAITGDVTPLTLRRVA